MLSSPLQCWWPYWSLLCWQEQCGSCTRGTQHAFVAFLCWAALITDRPAHRLQSPMETCWSQTWRLIQENSIIGCFYCSSSLSRSCCLSPFHRQVRLTDDTKAVTLTPQDSGEMMLVDTFYFQFEDAFEGSQHLFKVSLCSTFTQIKQMFVSPQYFVLTLKSTHFYFLKNEDHSCWNLFKKVLKSSLFVIILH